MAVEEPERRELWRRIERLEQRLDFVAKIAAPAWAFVVAWIAYEALVRGSDWKGHPAYIVALFVFAGVWLWLFMKLERDK